jgi:hypothetical protein
VFGQERDRRRFKPLSLLDCKERLPRGEFHASEHAIDGAGNSNHRLGRHFDVPEPKGENMTELGIEAIKYLLALAAGVALGLVMAILYLKTRRP